MREQDLHKIIRENGARDNKALAEELKKAHPEISQNTGASNTAAKKKSIGRRVAIFAPLASAAVLAVVLIPTLLLRNSGESDGSGGWSSSGDFDYSGDSGDPGGSDDFDYVGDPGGSGGSAQDPAYEKSNLQCTVQEYNELHGTHFLYLDRQGATEYSFAEYTRRSAGGFLGFSVSFKDTNTNDEIEYVVTADAETLAFLAYNISVCTNESTVSDIPIKWGAGYSYTYGIFDFDSYGYYITLKDDPDGTRLFEIAEELLLSQQ
ncbi:MAG: hypothetical protein NC184_03420 [Roseburia sp.]|nr:hypothetical protein [Roseburia sp.]